MTNKTVKVELSIETYKILEAVAKELDLTPQEALIKIVQESLEK